MRKKAVIISHYSWYDKRLEPIHDLLKREYDVTILEADFNHGSKTYKREEDRNPACDYVHVPPYKKNISVGRIYSALCFGRRAGKIIEKLQPDFIYLLMPPNNTARYCLRYKKAHPDAAYYVDLIDLWPEGLIPLRGEALKRLPPIKYWAKMRNDSIRAADHVFTECDFYQEQLADVIGLPERATTLRLFRNQSEEEYALVKRKLAEYVAAKDANANKFTLAYCGSINHIIDIAGIARLTRLLGRDGRRVEVRVIGDGEGREAFLSALKESGAAVSFYGKIFDQTAKIELLGVCDYALNMMKPGLPVGLTIKSVDYLSMGLPLANNIRGDTWNLVERESIGVNVGEDEGDEETLAEQFRRDIDRERVLQTFRNEFTRESFQERVRQFLERAAPDGK